MCATGGAGPMMSVWNTIEWQARLTRLEMAAIAGSGLGKNQNQQEVGQGPRLL